MPHAPYHRECSIAGRLAGGSASAASKSCADRRITRSAHTKERSEFTTRRNRKPLARLSISTQATGSRITLAGDAIRSGAPK